MNVAIPKLNEQIAPCFEAAREFEIAKIDGKRKIKSKTVACLDDEGFKRVRLLYLHDVEIVICNGIKGFYRDQLMSLGVGVILSVNDTVENAFERFLKNEFSVYEDDLNDNGKNYSIDHADLKSWAKEVLEANGYNIVQHSDNDSSLIDFVCEIKCPVCSKNVKIAVCCGGHTYRADQELMEFHRLAKTEYDARAFIYPENRQLAKNCEDFGIEYISPESVNLSLGSVAQNEIPIFSGRIEGHDKLNIREKSGD
jgi:predicted Fe-Mo cluster-binding NifX family protein